MSKKLKCCRFPRFQRSLCLNYKTAHRPIQDASVSIFDHFVNNIRRIDNYFKKRYNFFNHFCRRTPLCQEV